MINSKKKKLDTFKGMVGFLSQGSVNPSWPTAD